MSERLFNNVFYTHLKQVRPNFCTHTTANGTLTHALDVGSTTICVQCLYEKLQEVMAPPPNTIRAWCATCQCYRQTLDGVCTVCGGKDLR